MCVEAGTDVMSSKSRYTNVWESPTLRNDLTTLSTISHSVSPELKYTGHDARFKYTGHDARFKHTSHDSRLKYLKATITIQDLSILATIEDQKCLGAYR